MNGSPPCVTLMRRCSLNSLGDVSVPTLPIMPRGSVRSSGVERLLQRRLLRVRGRHKASAVVCPLALREALVHCRPGTSMRVTL